MRSDADISSLKLQPEEVSEVRWAERDEIHRMIGEGVFIPYFRSLIDTIFDLSVNENGID